MEPINVDTVEDLLVVWSSMEYDDSAPEVRNDALDVFARDTDDQLRQRRPDVVGFSETEGNPVRAVLRHAALNSGYRFRAGGPGGVAFALERRHKLLSVVDVRVLARMGGSHPHGERSIYGPVFETPAGNVVAYLLGHWTTLDRGLPKWRAMTEEMLDQLERQSVGRRIAIGAGDLNKRDGRNVDVFGSRADVTTVWDDVERWPDTYGRPDDGGPIDSIFTVDADRRVEVRGAYVGRRKGRKSDHRKVVARLRINPTGRPA